MKLVTIHNVWFEDFSEFGLLYLCFRQCEQWVSSFYEHKVPMATQQTITSFGSNAVYTGFWIDWDRGKVLGGTLTLKDKHAIPLLAALAIFVTLAGNRSWHLWRLFWHSLLRSNDRHQRAIEDHRRKQQVLLRNSETAGGATVSLFEEWFAFGIRRVIKESSSKDILLALFTVGHWIIFIILGILVSQIVLGRVVVSKALPTCGKWMSTSQLETGSPSTESDLIFRETILNATINSENYVRSCYPKGGSPGVVDCNRFISPSIPYTTAKNVDCPFETTACLPNAKSAYELLSANVTFSQFGLNDKYAKDISMQRKNTCSVLDSRVFLTK